MTMPHTIAVVMQDHSGVLHRTVSLLRRRGYNIESLAVGRSEVPGVSRMTLVVDAEDVEQVTRQLDRLVEVLAVCDVTHQPTVERETVLLKVDAPAALVASILSLTASYAARVAYVGPSSMVIELTDDPAKVESFIEQMRTIGIRELVRTGRVVLARGPAAPVTDGTSPGGDDPHTSRWPTQGDGHL
jgi:acetolactate synthase-1/3 small subunit